jgi:hypothetical protein
MSDPGTTYRTREEIQNMRSSNDAIQGMKSKLLEWGITTEKELKALDLFKQKLTGRKLIRKLGRWSMIKLQKPRSLPNVATPLNLTDC